LDDVAAVGAFVVAAAGNVAEPLTRPADCRGVLAVGAVRGDGAKASYSSYGPNVALSVPGGSGTGESDDGLLTTLNAGITVPGASTYGSLAGTSFAAPLVAGTAALMLGVQPGLTPADLIRLLAQSVRPHTAQATLPACSASALTQGVCNCTTDSCGHGLLDAGLAVASVQAAVAPAPSPPSTATPEGGGGHTGVAWGVALWAWLLLLGLSRRSAAAPAQPGRRPALR
jgi:serine protease